MENQLLPNMPLRPFVLLTPCTCEVRAAEALVAGPHSMSVHILTTNGCLSVHMLGCVDARIPHGKLLKKSNKL